MLWKASRSVLPLCLLAAVVLASPVGASHDYVSASCSEDYPNTCETEFELAAGFDTIFGSDVTEARFDELLVADLDPYYGGDAAIIVEWYDANDDLIIRRDCQPWATAAGRQHGICWYQDAAESYVAGTQTLKVSARLDTAVTLCEGACSFTATLCFDPDNDLAGVLPSPCHYYQNFL